MQTVLTYSKDSKAQLSTHFNAQEFRCPCDECKIILIDKILVSNLEALRTLLGSKLTITSGYRCEGYQEQLRIRGYETSKSISSHTLGLAADITNGVSPGLELADLAARAGFTNIGTGGHWIHVDVRPGGPRSWKYKS